MTKRYNQQNFHIEMPNGETYSFYCYTTNTRNGFCHTCYCSNNGKNSKVSYYNRTWESYDYQSVLYNAFEKLPKDVMEICKAWDKVKVKEGQEKAGKEGTDNARPDLYQKTNRRTCLVPGTQSGSFRNPCADIQRDLPCGCRI